MKIKSFVTYGTLAAITAILVSSCSAQGTENGEPQQALTTLQADEKDSAVSTAKSWLSLVDNGNYAESWKETDSVFQSAVTQEQWTNTMNGLRKPFGNLISRKLKSATHVTKLPGASDGEYVVMQFKTSFTNKKSAIETVTVGPKSGSQWKVSGYYMK